MLVYISEGVLSLTKNSQPSKCIPSIVAELNSKSGNVRAKVSEYLEYISTEYSGPSINKYFQVIQTGIQQTLNDANKDAREYIFSNQKLGTGAMRIRSSLHGTLRLGSRSCTVRTQSQESRSKILPRPKVVRRSRAPRIQASMGIGRGASLNMGRSRAISARA